MAKDELDLAVKTVQATAAAISDIMEAVSYSRLNASLRESERLKAEMLYELTNGGKTAPYLQEYDAENTKFSLLMKRKIEEYNLTADEKSRINFFFSETMDGHKVLWTDQAGAAKINDLRKELMIAFGDYYTEVKPSELYKANIDKQIISFDGITRAELDILKSKPGPGGTDFSLAAIPNGDGTYRIEISQEDFMAGKNREDLFINLMRANAIENNLAQNALTKELAYDRKLKESILKYDSSEPTYIASATDGGRYIKVNNEGFTVYNVGMNANDIRQQIEKEIKIKDVDLEKYKTELYNAISSINRPVEINNEIYKKNEMQFEKIYGKDAHMYATESRIKGAIMGDYEKMRMKFVSVREKNAPELLKQLERKANKSLSASIAAKITYDSMEANKKITPEMIPDLLGKEEVNRQIRTTFFKEHLIHMEPELHKQFMEQIKNTELYKQFEAAAVNPDLKDEVSKMIENSYEDFYFELNPSLQQRIKNEYRKFENEIKSNAELALNKGISPYTEQAIERIKNEEKNKALQIILAKSVTGKSLEGIRPMQTDIQSIREAEFEDELTRLFAQKVEKKLEENVGKANMTPDILKTTAYEQAVKMARDELEKNIRENKQKDESPKWAAVIKQADYFGGIDGTRLNDLAENALSLSEYETKCKEIDVSDLSWAVETEKEHPEHWENLEYEHNEEMIGRVLKESVKMEDVDLSGSIERMQHSFQERVNEADLKEYLGEDIDGEPNYDFDMIPDRNEDIESNGPDIDDEINRDDMEREIPI